MKIMIIDDDGMILKMASFILKRFGHETVTALSGDEGISLMRTKLPDLLLLDIEMPQKNGFETLEEIRADSSLSALKVCMMSGTVTGEIKSKAQSLGAVGVISKPLEAAEIADLLRG